MRPSRALARGVVVLLLCAAISQRPRNAPVRATAAIRLEMLAERIAKLHAQVGQGILADRSRRALGESVREFDATHRGRLAARAQDAEARDNYALLALLWEDYREWAMRAPTRDSARKLRSRTEEVVWIAAKGAKLVQENARGSVECLGHSRGDCRDAGAAHRQGAPVDALGHSRRRALPGVARGQREPPSDPRHAAQIARRDTPEIAVELRRPPKRRCASWTTRRAISRNTSRARAIEFIAKTGDNVYETMERLARLYEALAQAFGAGLTTSITMRQWPRSMRQTRMK